MKKHLPNAITLLNLFFGCLALVSVFRSDVYAVAAFTAAAAIADFLDGALARLLRVHSPLGAQLDSLADAVSFGAVPGAMFFYLLGGTQADAFPWAAVPGFIVTVFAALRLGRFNLDTRQTEHFIGLPTPAATIFVLGWLLVVHTDALGWGEALGRKEPIYAAIIGLAWLMNAELPMFSLKFKALQWKGNEVRIIFAAMSVALLIWLQAAALLPIILIYIAVSVILHGLKSNRTE